MRGHRVGDFSKARLSRMGDEISDEDDLIMLPVPLNGPLYGFFTIFLSYTTASPDCIDDHRVNGTGGPRAMLALTSGWRTSRPSGYRI